MARRYKYESEEIKQDYKLLRDRLYHASRRGGDIEREAYKAVKRALDDINYIDRSVLDDIEDIYESTININNVDPYKYDESMANMVYDKLYELYGSTYYEFDKRSLAEVLGRFDSFIGEIGRKAFSDFIDQHPEILHEMEVIAAIYKNYVENLHRNGDKNVDYEYLEMTLNAALNFIENLYSGYMSSEAYEEYKNWEAQISGVFNGY